MTNQLIRTHPLTGEPLVPVGTRRDGRLIWPILGAADDADGGDDGDTGDDNADTGDGQNDTGDQGDKGKGGDKGDDRGYPKDTALADMTTEQREAYWKYHAQKHERAFKNLAGKDMTPDKIAELLTKQEEAERERMTEHQRALEDAKKEARESALAEARTISVRAIMDAHIAAAGLDKTKPEDQDVIDTVQALDPSIFIKDDTVDADKLTKVLSRIIPSKGSNTGTWPDTGQGRRDTGTGSAKDAGLAEAARRWPDKVKADT